MKNLPKLTKKRVALIILGFVLGVASFIVYRMARVQSQSIHYHANFALYIDGQRDDFKSFTFYEEVQACVSDGAQNPKARVHMHNQDPDTLHIHSGGVTWGHFFANIGYGLSNKSVETDAGVFAEQKNNSKQLRFILNGEEVDTAANRLIESEDRLLIDFSDTKDEVLRKRFDEVARDAGEFNGKHDPGGCSGNQKLTLLERFKSSTGLEKPSSGHSH